MRVALIRGDDLNRFEMQAYEQLPALGIQVLGVGSHRPNHELDGLTIPIARLRQPGRCLPSRVQRITRRALGHYADRLVGLEGAVESCQVLHSAETFMPFSEQAARLARRTNRSLVVTCWENIPYRHDDMTQLAHRKRDVQRAASKLLAVTQEAAQALQIEGVDADRIAVVPPGVNCEHFRPARATGHFFKAWGIPDGARVVLAVGRIIDEKGWLDLLLAARQVRRKATRNVVVVFLGRGPREAALLRATESLGIQDSVRVAAFTPYDRLPDAYASADVVVLASRPTPYWEEQFGMVLIEAMACGRPVVATRCGSIPGVVGDAAALTNPYAPEELATCLTNVLGDDAYAQHLARAGADRVARLYDARIVASALAEMYRGIGSGRVRQSGRLR